MKRPAVVVSAFTLAAMGCAAQAPPQPHAQHHAVTSSGPAARVVDLPATAGAGEPREVRVLAEEPALKLVTIVLRQGTVLPEHRSPAAVTIQALRGAGTVVTGGETGSERMRIDETHAVVLAPNVPHAVEPDAATDLVLLVHHAGGRGGEDHH